MSKEIRKMELMKELKKTSTAYILLFFLGAHHIYMGSVVKQIAYWLTCGGLGIWMIYDLTTLGKKVREHNESIYDQIERL